MARLMLVFSFLLTASCAHTAVSPKEHGSLEKRTAPVVIGHRGASGYRPEHTIEAYDLAIAQGADFIEPDLVITKDGALIARHENEISGTTDVATKFPTRKTTKQIDGQSVTGWFAEDFTLAEIRSLRARERLPHRDHSHDGRYLIPTLEEVVALAKRRSEELGRIIGIYPETKHPTFFRMIGKPLEPVLARVLTKAGWTKPTDPVIIQSFELTSLRITRELISARLVFLYGDSTQRPYDFVMSKDGRTYGQLLTPASLKTLSNLLYGIGPDKRLIVPQAADGKLLPPTSVVADAHAAGLAVHPYTFRSDSEFLAPEYAGDPTKEYQQFLDLEVDGFFSDFPDHARRAVGSR